MPEPALPDTMKALVQTAPGAELELQELPLPRPGRGEVLVRIAASPINPSDLHFLKGEYGLKWPYPLVPGLEGSGQVVAAGAGLMGRYVMGKPVACSADRQGCWAEYTLTRADRCLPLPRDLPLGVAAMAVVNPLTAQAFMDIARAGGHGALINSAAAGALGGIIRKMGRAQGLRVIDVVRGQAQRERLLSERATDVLDMAAPGFDADLARACRDADCRLALDAVGGALTGRLVEALRPGGEVLVYGALDAAAATLNPGTMIFRGITVRGFWLSKWLDSQSLPAKLMTMRKVVRSLQSGQGTSTVARVVDLEDAADAPAAYAANMSAGKILISSGALPLGLS